MEKIIEAMLSDTPFVVNLENKDYMSILLDGKETLEERFAEIDAKQIREELEKSFPSSAPQTARCVISYPFSPKDAQSANFFFL